MLAALPKGPKACGTALGGGGGLCPCPPQLPGSQEGMGHGCCSTSVFQTCRVLSNCAVNSSSHQPPNKPWGGARGALIRAKQQRSLIKRQPSAWLLQCSLGKGPGWCTSAGRRKATSIPREGDSLPVPGANAALSPGNCSPG